MDKFNAHQVTMGIKKSIKQQNSKQKRHIAPKSKEFRSWILRKVIDNGKNNSLNIWITDNPKIWGTHLNRREVLMILQAISCADLDWCWGSCIKWHQNIVILLACNLGKRALRILLFHTLTISLRFDYHYDPYSTPLNFVQSEAERIQPDFNFVLSEGKAREISRR